MYILVWSAADIDNTIWHSVSLTHAHAYVCDKAGIFIL